MKKSIYITLFALIAIISCQKEDDGLEASEEEIVSSMTEVLTLHEQGSLVYEQAMMQSNSDMFALEALGTWIGQQEEVETAFYTDQRNIELHHKNGLISNIGIDVVNEQGISFSRGGSGGSSPTIFNFMEDPEIKPIKNEKVMVFIPYATEFEYTTASVQDIVNNLEGSDLEVDVFIEDGYGIGNGIPTVEVVNRMKDYGLIILDTHGKTNGFLIGKVDREGNLTDALREENVRSQFLNRLKIPINAIALNHIRIISKYSISGNNNDPNYKYVSYEASALITEDYIRSMSGKFDDAVVFGNHCYSGHTADGPTTNNMSQAWRSKGVASYFGYASLTGKATVVENDFAKQVEKRFIQSLVTDKDTTGVAHLKENGDQFVDPLARVYLGGNFKVDQPSFFNTIMGERAPQYFFQYHDTNYAFQGCATDKMKDPRDGKEYKTNKIGGKVWMAENLNYEAKGLYYQGDLEGEKYGRLYSLYETLDLTSSTASSTVKGICPEGWHVPSMAEFDKLIADTGGVEATKNLRKKDAWPKVAGATDKFCFGLKPNPYAYKNETGLSYLGQDPEDLHYLAYLRSSTAAYDSINGDTNQLLKFDGRDSGNVRFEYRNISSLNTSFRVGVNYFPCRCVKD